MCSKWLLATGAFAVGFLAVASADHSWGNYHWPRSANPVTIVLGDNVDSTWDQWLAEASFDWSASSALFTSVEGGQAKGNCKPPDGRVEICNGLYGYNGWLGLAQIWVNGDHIVKGVAKMNDTYHSQSPYDTDAWRDLVMCQEVGHTFGLGHQDENFNGPNLGTCMDYTSDPDGPPANLQPNAHDYEELEAIYAHLDAPAGGEDSPPCRGPAWKCEGAQPPPAFDMELPGRGQWGTMIAVSRDGGQSVFVQDFGNGYRVYTHVTWTLDIAERLAAGR